MYVFIYEIFRIALQIVIQSPLHYGYRIQSISEPSLIRLIPSVGADLRR